MIETYFTLKFVLTIIPVVFLLIIIMIGIANLFIRYIRNLINNVKKNYLLKRGFERQLYETEPFLYRFKKGNLSIKEYDVEEYSLREIKKMIKDK